MSRHVMSMSLDEVYLMRIDETVNSETLALGSSSAQRSESVLALSFDPCGYRNGEPVFSHFLSMPTRSSSFKGTPT